MWPCLHSLGTQGSSWFVKMSCLQPVAAAAPGTRQLPYHKFVKLGRVFITLSFCIKWGIFRPFHSLGTG